MKDLNEIKGAVRGLLGQSVKMRRIPSLEFVIDTSSAYGAKIDAILDSLGFGMDYRQGVNGDDDEGIGDAEGI